MPAPKPTTADAPAPAPERPAPPCGTVALYYTHPEFGGLHVCTAPFDPALPHSAAGVAGHWHYHGEKAEG